MTPMKKLCLLLLAALAATGCNEDSASEIFSGKDNHIASFALTKDGVTYDAVISQNRITVTVPYNVSLAGATATYELSENAAIQPAPATVTDWESERQFLVTSYNKTDRAYLYSVEYADVVSAGNVTLNTQREVTNFGQTGISVIDGNLAVGTRRSDDPVKTLDGLERLVAVGNNLTIGAAYAGETLTGKGTGLSNLKEVRGNITLSEQNASLKGFSLPSLKSATGDITLVNKALETVEMPVLKRVGGTLEVRSNALILMTADLLTHRRRHDTFGFDLENGSGSVRLFLLSGTKNRLRQPVAELFRQSVQYGNYFPCACRSRKHHLRGPVQSQRIHTSGSRNPRRHIPRFMFGDDRNVVAETDIRRIGSVHGDHADPQIRMSGTRLVGRDAPSGPAGCAHRVASRLSKTCPHRRRPLYEQSFGVRRYARPQCLHVRTGKRRNPSGSDALQPRNDCRTG